MLGLLCIVKINKGPRTFVWLALGYLCFNLLFRKIILIIFLIPLHCCSYFSLSWLTLSLSHLPSWWLSYQPDLDWKLSVLLVALWPQATYFTSLSFNFLICKTKILVHVKQIILACASESQGFKKTMHVRGLALDLLDTKFDKSKISRVRRPCFRRLTSLKESGPSITSPSPSPQWSRIAKYKQKV